MIRKLGALTAMLLLGACASDMSLSDRLAGSDRVSGDADGVRVFGMGSRLEALPLAVGHCAKFHRSAQFAGRVPRGYSFRCVSE